MKIKYSIGFVCFVIGLAVCFSVSCVGPDKPMAEKKQADENKTTSGSNPSKRVLPPYARNFNDGARYLSGMPPLQGTTVDSSLLKSASWIQFASALDKNWKKFDSTKLARYKSWRDQELKEINTSAHTLFYPFSGPDLVHAVTFFPAAEKYILIGLEPVGSFPDFGNGKTDSLDNFLNSVNRSLFAILNFSFFRTKSMAKDLKGKELDGTLPILLLFLERTGNTVMDVKTFSLDTSGFAGYKVLSGNEKNAGVEIDYFGGDSIPRKLMYFSVNLHNSSLEKNNAFMKFLRQQRNIVTYLKSASYLMFKNHFSIIRGYILANSRCVLQDDSGIPYRFFSNDNWDVQLYGTYTKPLPMFSAHFQQDYKNAYSDSLKIKKLDFGIGYIYKNNKSNLLLATLRRKNA